MKATFGSRLFRLFLVLSITPALILTLFGFYLVLELGHVMGEPAGNLDTRVADYYNNLNFDRIDTALARVRPGTNTRADYLDFSFVSDGDSVDCSGVYGGLSVSAAGTISKSAVGRTRGFADVDGRIYQFSRRTLDDGRTLYGGMSHDSAYTSLITSLQTDHALQSAGRELRPRYIFFLSSLFVGLSFLTFVVAYIMSARISRGLARPLTELSRSAERIAAGDFRQHVEPAGDDEIRTLILNFNDMSDRLERTTTRLAQSERVAAWRQVARRFAHELKNPIQPILVSLYRIEKQLSGTDAYPVVEEPLRAASDELNHLRDLAERFSELARLPAPKMERVCLNQLITSVAALYQQQLAPFQFRLALPAPDVCALADQAHLREALHNVLQNAIDASNPGGEISLTLTGRSSRALIILRDNGRGMDAGTLAASRLPYFTTKETGTGLGLAIVEKSINEMGGELYIESTEGIGTTISISLPGEGTENAG